MPHCTYFSFVLCQSCIAIGLACRDGKHFGKVLNYVRDGCERITLPPSREIRQELRAEADYYNLTSLIEMIDQHEAGLVRREEATSAAMASLIFDAMEAVTAADNLSKMFAELGTTRQTELAVRLPALQLKIQTALLRLVDAHVRSHGTL